MEETLEDSPERNRRFAFDCHSDRVNVHGIRIHDPVLEVMGSEPGSFAMRNPCAHSVEALFKDVVN